jgi:hypothetical protein
MPGHVACQLTPASEQRRDSQRTVQCKADDHAPCNS